MRRSLSTKLALDEATRGVRRSFSTKLRSAAATSFGHTSIRRSGLEARGGQARAPHVPLPHAFVYVVKWEAREVTDEAREVTDPAGDTCWREHMSTTRKDES